MGVEDATPSGGAMGEGLGLVAEIFDITDSKNYKYVLLDVASRLLWWGYVPLTHTTSLHSYDMVMFCAYSLFLKHFLLNLIYLNVYLCPSIFSDHCLHNETLSTKQCHELVQLFPILLSELPRNSPSNREI